MNITECVEQLHQSCATYVHALQQCNTNVCLGESMGKGIKYKHEPHMCGNGGGVEAGSSREGKVANVAGKEISKTFFAQLPHVLL